MPPKLPAKRIGKLESVIEPLLGKIKNINAYRAKSRDDQLSDRAQGRILRRTRRYVVRLVRWDASRLIAIGQLRACNIE